MIEIRSFVVGLTVNGNSVISSKGNGSLATDHFELAGITAFNLMGLAILLSNLMALWS
jgi:hypothetical protein